ncbi:MAG: hypothetical protein JWO71_2770 [Candidatus Acidoferrum typicum]|nr:hypothetical protein [Candidatus Acidoferrum typicum]
MINRNKVFPVAETHETLESARIISGVLGHLFVRLYR